MFLLFHFLTMINVVRCDLIPIFYQSNSTNTTNTIDENYIIISTLWFIGCCSCFGFVCCHKIHQYHSKKKLINSYSYSDNE